MECRHCKSSQSIKLASKIFCANCGLPQQDYGAIKNNASSVTTNNTISKPAPAITNNTSLASTQTQNISQHSISPSFSNNTSIPSPPPIAPINTTPVTVSTSEQSIAPHINDTAHNKDTITTNNILSRIFKKKRDNNKITPEAIDAVFANIGQDNNDTNNNTTSLREDTNSIHDNNNESGQVDQSNNQNEDQGMGLVGMAKAQISDADLNNDDLSINTPTQTIPIQSPEISSTINTPPQDVYIQSSEIPSTVDDSNVNIKKNPQMSMTTNGLITDINTSPAIERMSSASKTVDNSAIPKQDSLQELVNTVSRIDDVDLIKETIKSNDQNKPINTEQYNPLDLSKTSIDDVGPNAKDDLSAKNILSGFKPANVALSIIGIVILGIYIWQVNYSSIALRFAASKSGLSANVPGYMPTGWQLSNKFQAEPGRLTFSLVSPDSKSSIAINQVKTSWNTQDLLENFVLAKSDNYLALQSQGTTIYIYGKSQASWVEDGKWYRIEGDNNLSNDDLVKLASSI